VTRVVLFDIDGTLVLTGGAGVRAMTRAFEELFAVPNAFQDIPMPGRTDARILYDAAAAHGIPTQALGQFRPAYLSHLSVEIEKPGPRKGVMPGVRPLLDELSRRDDLFLALLTGNFEEAARVKLQYFDLWRYFPCGAFGDETPDRNHLVPAALARVRECGGPEVDGTAATVVGDTPLDIACAATAGARSVAVATGSYDVDALRAAGGDIVLDDLSDLDAVLAAIGAESR
jgi:phosphoglycolate phosphatase-like HAD superfamily hydrolase